MFAWCVSVARYPTRKRQRLRDFDYSSPGFYFVTICTAGRAVRLVGAVETLIRDEMLALSVRFPGAILDEHVVMTDHVHLILQLNGATVPLPRIIQAFKSLTTIASARMLRMSGLRIWQRGYYDRVIRSDEELLALRQYIRNNPLALETGRTSDAGRARDAGRASSAPTSSPSITRRA
jgi:putative transposase